MGFTHAHTPTFVTKPKGKAYNTSITLKAPWDCLNLKSLQRDERPTTHLLTHCACSTEVVQWIRSSSEFDSRLCHLPVTLQRSLLASVSSSANEEMELVGSQGPAQLQKSTHQIKPQPSLPVPRSWTQILFALSFWSWLSQDEEHLITIPHWLTLEVLTYHHHTMPQPSFPQVE